MKIILVNKASLRNVSEQKKLLTLNHLLFQARCHSALEVMRHTLVPWSEAVETLIEEVMTNYPKY